MNFITRSTVSVTYSCFRMFSKGQSIVKLADTSLLRSLAPTCASCAHRQVSVVTTRQKHTPSMSMSLDELSTWRRMKWNMGFYGNLRVPSFKLKLSGYHLYVCCTDFIDFNQFVQDAELPDTFSSWFQLLQLHIWMLNVKLSQIGLEGVLLKDYAYKAMWQSVEMRLDTFKDLLGSEKRKYMQGFYNSMFLSIMYLDEGLIGNDKQLANALWISLYNMSEDVNPEKLELMVEYVRKQVFFHDQLNADKIMFPGYLPFLPLHGDQLDKVKAERDYKSLVGKS